MIYNDFCGLKLSSLGMGCMRLPVKESYENIDIEATKEMVAYAMEKGVNYYDTAWGYHNGNSEIVMGEVLKAYDRSRFYLASKFPGYDLDNMGRVEEIFEKQLQKCQTEYFDFYMFHNLCEMNVDAYLDPKFGILEYLLKQKGNGRIKHLGVSAHGSLETMKKFLDAYGSHMEFCQIQLNWLDWEFQNAKEKVEMLKGYGIPVWVMEPLRGGSLVKLEEKYEATLKALAPERTLPQWAFRFLQGINGVTVTLSGMSDLQQLKENIATFETNEPLTQNEADALVNIARAMTSKETLPCTSCKYCVNHCPLELDIPWFIELYNEHIYSGGGFIAPMAISGLEENKRPSACLGCKACESVCPQSIKISEMMSDFASKVK